MKVERNLSNHSGKLEIVAIGFLKLHVDWPWKEQQFGRNIRLCERMVVGTTLVRTNVGIGIEK